MAALASSKAVVAASRWECRARGSGSGGHAVRMGGLRASCHRPPTHLPPCPSRSQGHPQQQAQQPAAMRQLAGAAGGLQLGSDRAGGACCSARRAGCLALPACSFRGLQA